MDDETNQEIVGDLENTSATDTSDNSESEQKTEEAGENQEPSKKQPKIWQVVRGIQKSLDELKQSDKTEKKAEPQAKHDDLSPKDLYALMDAKVPQGQVDEVIKASKILGKSIPETLKDGFVQARLKTLSEEQETANATNTGTSKRTSPKLTDEQIVQNFMEGKAVDPEALAVARMNLRKKR